MDAAGSAGEESSVAAHRRRGASTRICWRSTGPRQRALRSPAASAEDFHLPTPRGGRLDAVFRLRQLRSVSNDWVVPHHGRFFFNSSGRRGLAPARSTVLVLEIKPVNSRFSTGGRAMRWTEILAPARLIPARPVSPTIAPTVAVRIKPVTPSRTHPWRKAFTEAARPIWQVSDQ